MRAACTRVTRVARPERWPIRRHTRRAGREAERGAVRWDLQEGRRHMNEARASTAQIALCAAATIKNDECNECNESRELPHIARTTLALWAIETCARAPGSRELSSLHRASVLPTLLPTLAASRRLTGWPRGRGPSYRHRHRYHRYRTRYRHRCRYSKVHAHVHTCNATPRRDT